MKRIGIFGGTFNPVHVEHVAMVKNAIKELNLDKLIVMPTFISPHKSEISVSAEHRLNMLKLAFDGISKVEISDYEVLKQGKSYTYLTITHFKKLYPNASLYFIVGGDMLTDFKTWKEPSIILENCTLAVINRVDQRADIESEREYFLSRFGKDFILLDYLGGQVSSTKIRTYLEFGLALEGIIDDRVMEYINANNLYAPSKYVCAVKEFLPTKRLKHTANVVISALEKVKELNLDAEKVKLSATLHDIAKYVDASTVKGFKVKKDMPKPVVHAFLGGFIAKNRLGIQDDEIIDAITYHTSGKANMTTLSKLIFVADMIEEDRDYDGVNELRYLFKNADFETCFRTCLFEEMQHLKNKGGDIYFETINAYEYYKNN